MTRRAVLLMVILVLPGLVGSSAGYGANDAVSPWAGPVRVDGTVRAMMHEGQTQAKVTLDTLLPNPHLYAVGALAELVGEATVIGGVAYLSYPLDSVRTRTEQTEKTNAGAALLVSADVENWKSVTIDHAIPFDKIDDEIARLAKAAGAPTDGRLPFLVEGELENLQLHVIDGKRLKGSSHEAHRAASVLTTLPRASATLIGFYSENDQGVFTHMGSRTHIHCVVGDPLASGHVDHVDIPAGSTLKFPA